MFAFNLVVVDHIMKGKTDLNLLFYFFKKQAALFYFNNQTFKPLNYLNPGLNMVPLD